MSLINGVLILLVCQCAGEAIKSYFGLSLPGPAIGMFILFIGLVLYQDVPEAVAKSSRSLIPLLGLMFLPAAAGLFFLGSQYSDQWLAIIAAVVVGSLLSLIFNGLLMTFLARKRNIKS